MATSGHVAHPEIADDRAAEFLSNDGAFANLQCPAHGESQIFTRHRLMMDGLPMAPDQIDHACLYCGFLAEMLAGPGIQVAEQHPHATDLDGSPEST
ncbi:hypothetical protein SDC9_200107 [bioreactor metagenome]|uniref:Uncharacterized protein n=1 Tax=bioreactor metagenome TaxID=1076179 RepID=A0A645IM93_9ZZZZ